MGLALTLTLRSQRQPPPGFACICGFGFGTSSCEGSYVSPCTKHKSVEVLASSCFFVLEVQVNHASSLVSGPCQEPALRFVKQMNLGSRQVRPAHVVGPPKVGPGTLVQGLVILRSKSGMSCDLGRHTHITSLGLGCTPRYAS